MAKQKAIPALLRPWQRTVYLVFGYVGTYIWWLAGALLVVLVAVSLGQLRTNGSDVKIDPRNIFVSDNAHLLSQQTKAAVLAANKRYAKLANHPQLLVITVADLPTNTSIEEFTVAQATRLGVGDAKTDSGVVYLLAKNARQARLEVGYGMEAQIPDAMTDVVTDATVKADYRRNDYDTGVRLVTTRLDHLIRTGKVGTITSPRAAHSWTLDPWRWLNTPHSTFALWTVVLGIVALLFLAFVYGGKALRRVRLDILTTRYLAALSTTLPNTTPQQLRTNKDQYAKAKQLLAVQLGVTSNAKVQVTPAMPDYFSFSFAFGHYSPVAFMQPGRRADARFKKTSMFLRHRNDWYRARWSWVEKLSKMRTRTAKVKVAKNDVRPYLLTPTAWLFWHLARVLTNFVVLLMLISAGYGWLSGSGKPAMQLAINSWQSDIIDAIFLMFSGVLNGLTGLLSFLVQVYNSGQTPLQLLTSLTILFVIGATLTGVSIWRRSVWRKLRLNWMIRRYLNDLRAEWPAAVTTQVLIPLLMSENKQLIATKAKLEVKLQAARKKKQKAQPKRKLRGNGLPAYYDMAFAFGSLSCARFLSMRQPTAQYQRSSMYASYAPWSGGSSGGDSFGGGSFGGGGGTSSW